MICVFDDDSRMLGFYPVQDYFRINILDANPNRVNANYFGKKRVSSCTGIINDIIQMWVKWKSLKSLLKNMKREQVSLFLMSVDSVLAYKKKHKIGRFADKSNEELNDYAQEAISINVGDRFQSASDDGSFKRG